MKCGAKRAKKRASGTGSLKEHEREEHDLQEHVKGSESDSAGQMGASSFSCICLSGFRLELTIHVESFMKWIEAIPNSSLYSLPSLPSTTTSESSIPTEALYQWLSQPPYLIPDSPRSSSDDYSLLSPLETPRSPSSSSSFTTTTPEDSWVSTPSPLSYNFASQQDLYSSQPIPWGDLNSTFLPDILTYEQNDAWEEPGYDQSLFFPLPPLTGGNLNSFEGDEQDRGGLFMY